MKRIKYLSVIIILISINSCEKKDIEAKFSNNNLVYVDQKIEENNTVWNNKIKNLDVAYNNLVSENQKIEESASALLNKIAKLGKGLKNEWNLDPGIYYTDEIIIESPQIINDNILNIKDIIVANKEKINILDSNELTDYSDKFHYYDTSFIKNELENLEDLGNLDKIPLASLDRSCGGSRKYLTKKNNKMIMVTWITTCGFIEKISYSFSKIEPLSPQIKYDIKFPWYAIIDKCNVYKEPDINSEFLFEIIGNQRGGKYNNLTNEGVESIVKLNEVKVIDQNIFFKVTYKGKEGWILKNQSIIKAGFRNIEALLSNISSEYGL